MAGGLLVRTGEGFVLGISLCNLRVLCVSVVWFYSEFINHRDTEDTEVAQRRARSRLLCKAPVKRSDLFYRRLEQGQVAFLCSSQLLEKFSSRHEFGAECFQVRGQHLDINPIQATVL